VAHCVSWRGLGTCDIRGLACCLHRHSTGMRFTKVVLYAPHSQHLASCKHLAVGVWHGLAGSHEVANMDSLLLRMPAKGGLAAVLTSWPAAMLCWRAATHTFLCDTYCFADLCACRHVFCFTLQRCP
jgi:hypothetical protein